VVIPAPHAAFATAMAQLGPFEPQPFLAAAVSGGADSLALALMADHWARARGGSVCGLVVDHGLRPESAAEAATTIARLASRGIAARLLTLRNLERGPALAARARTARYEVLIEACAAAGCLHLLLGHHRGDQAETLMMRALSNSRSAGLAAMPALRELATVRLLRPLLTFPPDCLRTLLLDAGLDWVEDPSNRDPHALRARLRTSARSDEAGLAAAATTAGQQRTTSEEHVAEVLATRVTLRPEGFALLTPGRIMPEALAALLQTLAGAPFPPASAPVEALAAAPGPATLAGVRILAAGRFGPGWLLVREAASMQAPVAAKAGAAKAGAAKAGAATAGPATAEATTAGRAATEIVWDGRFRLSGTIPDGLSLGALGAEAAGLRRRSDLPGVVMRTLPALRRGNSLVAVPHIRYLNELACADVRLRFHPAQPMAGASFRSAGSVWSTGSE
jgi:tRNA(Ile)-lysidine synthase